MSTANTPKSGLPNSWSKSRFCQLDLSQSLLTALSYWKQLSIIFFKKKKGMSWFLTIWVLKDHFNYCLDDHSDVIMCGKENLVTDAWGFPWMHGDCLVSCSQICILDCIIGICCQFGSFSHTNDVKLRSQSVILILVLLHHPQVSSP